MKIVSVKFDEEILNKIDSTFKQFNYNSRTEFIRGAIREKLDALEKEKLIREFMSLKGKATKKTSYEDNFKTKKDMEKEIHELLEKRFR